jgi:hypothetical protein
MAPRSVRIGVRSPKLSNVGQSLDGWPKIYYLELLRASKCTFSRWFRLHLQSLAPANPHWAHVVSYGPFSLCVIHKECLWPSSGSINRLMMMMIKSTICLLSLIIHVWFYICLLSFNFDARRLLEINTKCSRGIRAAYVPHRVHGLCVAASCAPHMAPPDYYN